MYSLIYTLYATTTILFSYKLLYFTYSYLNGNFKNLKTVFILRGLPGSGKKTLIDKLITNLSNNYSLKESDYLICSNHDYFLTNSNSNKYSNYNISELPRASANCLNTYIEGLSDNLPYIFISNTNSQYWEYENYLELAKLFGYKVKVLELECPSDNYISYFCDRSKNKVPFSNCKTYYKQWESNPNDILITAYESDHEGDSLPYPKKSKEQLDRELDEISHNLQTHKIKQINQINQINKSKRKSKLN